MAIFPTNILVGVDGSAGGVRAARAAVELANTTGYRPHVAHEAPAPDPIASPGTMILAPGIVRRSQEAAERAGGALLTERVRSSRQRAWRSSKPEGPVEVSVQDTSEGLPEVPGIEIEPREFWVMPLKAQAMDPTKVEKSFEFEGAQER
jgi:nucleotide-binding universal stress UspA family protein